MAESTFTWGNAGERLTPSDRRRKVAEAMLLRGASTAPIQHWTQGAARIAEALLGGYESGRLDREEKAAQASLNADVSFLMGGGAPAAASAPATPAAAPSMAGAGASRAMAMPNTPPEVKDGIIKTANAIGADPVDLATAISYETGGTFNPTQAGPRTKWGQHRGFIQFGEPQAKQHGVDWANPVGSQLGPDGAIASYMKASGYKPGMGFLDLYSTINAGAPGLYNRSDAAAGGAPGTVRDKVEKQMAGHRAKAMALLGDPNAPAPGASPVAMEGGQAGFAVPPAPVASISGDDPVTLRKEAQFYASSNPEAARQMLARADAAEAATQPAAPPMPQPGDLAVAPSTAPAMSPLTFNAIASGEPPLDPVFQSEGVAQPWMGTALPPQPAAPQVAQAPLPPPRPADLAMPQADIPAPGAVPAIGQMPMPAATPDLSNSPDGGMRAYQLASEQARQAQAPAPQDGASPVQRIAAALSGGTQAQPAASSPAAAAVAQAVAPAAAGVAAAASPGTERVAAAMRVLNSPYAQPGQRAVANLIVQQAFKDPTETEMKRLALDKARREADGAPLEREAKQLEIDAKKKALAETKPPPTLKVKQADGSEVTLEWDSKGGTYVPLRAPLGGAAVGPTPSNPYALPGKPTEDQSKSAGFANRMAEAHTVLEGVEELGADKGQSFLDKAPFGLNNVIISKERQSYNQAKENFITAVLRKESGAVIGDSEFKREEQKYFPQPGDTAEQMKQKRQSRITALKSMMGSAGTGYKVPEGLNFGEKKPRESNAEIPPAPTGVDATAWKFMTPQERALWK